MWLIVMPVVVPACGGHTEGTTGAVPTSRPEHPIRVLFVVVVGDCLVLFLLPNWPNFVFELQSSKCNGRAATAFNDVLLE